MVADGRMDDGRTPDHGHPISSPCEPNGSGELIKQQPHVNKERSHVRILRCYIKIKYDFLFINIRLVPRGVLKKPST